MSATTSIEWTDRTWNPVRGCSIVSKGCHKCYAMKQAHRFSGPGMAYEGLTVLTERSGPQWTGVIRTVDAALLEPLSWRKPLRIFVNSMSDLFHADVPDAFIDKVFAVMALSPQHTFQILTKRPELMRHYVSTMSLSRLYAACRATPHAPREPMRPSRLDWPLPNVWLGVSVENQKYADERIPLLLQTPAAVRFISAEPLLGPVTLREHLMSGTDPGRCANCGKGHGFTRCPNYGGISPTNEESRCINFRRANFALGWIIVGGESGHRARPFDVAWARSIVQQCKAAGVAVFVKQLGAKPIEEFAPQCDALVNLTHRKGADITEWPEDLRVREFPISPVH